ncbi:MAG: hypothetical protein ACLSAH_01935 [Bilophila wadsworthia]
MAPGWPGSKPAWGPIPLARSPCRQVRHRAPELNELLAESASCACIAPRRNHRRVHRQGGTGAHEASALLVNMARGGIGRGRPVRSPARQVISGAIIDAYSQERSPLPAVLADNVIPSPHAGAFTTDALNAMSRMSVDQLFQYVDGATPDNLVTAE